MVYSQTNCVLNGGAKIGKREREEEREGGREGRRERKGNRKNYKCTNDVYETVQLKASILASRVVVTTV